MHLPGPKNPKNWQNLHRVAKLGLAEVVVSLNIRHFEVPIGDDGEQRSREARQHL
jgi:hypothetical protein